MSFLTSMTISDKVMVAAVILGPIFAIQVEKIIEHWKEKRSFKLWIFKTLMRTRGATLSPLHVEALNMIELEFYPREKFKKIIEAWKVYLDHLHSFPQNKAENDYENQVRTWTEKKNDLLVDLLFEMAKELNYEFDRLSLKKGVYSPQGHADAEWEQVLIRKSLVTILSGKNSIPVSIIEKDSK